MHALIKSLRGNLLCMSSAHTDRFRPTCIQGSFASTTTQVRQNAGNKLVTQLTRYGYFILKTQFACAKLSAEEVKVD